MRTRRAASDAGRRSADAVLRALGRTIVYIIVLTQVVNWGNQIAVITDTTVKNVLHADPSNVYQQYNQALQAQKSTTSQTSWWEKLFNVGTRIGNNLQSVLREIAKCDVVCANCHRVRTHVGRP